MTYKLAKKELRKIGVAHATGDSLIAMYAEAITSNHGGKAELYYDWISAQGPVNDVDVQIIALPLVKDRAKAWDVLLGVTA